jgi:hypothetical protein
MSPWSTRFVTIAVMATREQRFEADRKFTYRALQDARQYNTDVDRGGRKAEAIYERLARANRLMYPWSTDGTEAQSKKAIEYLNEITSILSEKIGPASRREFREQGGSRDHSTKKRAAHAHATKKKSGAQLDREIAEVLTKEPGSGGPCIVKISGGKSFAGQKSFTANVQYPGEKPSSVEFVGPSSGGGPVVMITQGRNQTFVHDPSRFGPFGADWVRRFFASA